MKILETLGTCGRYRVNKMVWEKEDNLPKGCIIPLDHTVIDVRRWSNDAPGIGIAIDESAIIPILLRFAADPPKPEKPIMHSRFGKTEYWLWNVLATLRPMGKGKLLFTRSSFCQENDLRYDIRYWSDNLGSFSPGASLTSDEANQLGLCFAQYADTHGLYVPKIVTDATYSVKDLICSALLKADRFDLLDQILVLLKEEEKK